MGRNSAEIQRDLDRQRDAVETRIRRLQQRIRDDAGTVGDEARVDIDRALGPGSPAAEHPKALVAGAAGAGMALGMLSSRVSVRPHVGSQNGSKPEAAEDGRAASRQESKGSRLASMATAGAIGSVQGQLNQMVGEVWDSFKTGFRRNHMADERSKEDRERLARERKADPRTSELTREEIEPLGPDVDNHDDRTPEKLAHDAKVQDYDPRAELGASAGVQGEGLALATPDPDGPLDEGRSERRTGQ